MIHSIAEKQSTAPKSDDFANIGLPGKDRKKKQSVQAESRSPWDWTGQAYPVGSLMQIAVANPQGSASCLPPRFCGPQPSCGADSPHWRAWEQQRERAAKSADAGSLG
jgi:hypothetical protein